MKTSGHARICRRHALGLLLLPLASCVSEAPPPPVYTPLDYAYLAPLRLNVARIEIDDSWTPPGAQDLSALSPVQPVDALRRMLHERLLAAGNAGRALATIEDGSIVQGYGGLAGHFSVRLDIFTSGETPAAYAEASVARTLGVPPGGSDTMQSALYTLTRQMMDDMNVELEYQVRRSLHDWLQDTNPAPSVVPAPVQQQPLPPPS